MVGRAVRRRRLSVGLAVVALLATGCGARLDPAVRQAAIDGPGGPVVVAGEGAEAAPGGAVAAGPGATTSTADAGVTTPGDPGTVGSTDGATGGGVATGPTSAGGEPGPAASGGQAPASGPDTRSVPAGGNGGATDVGVFEDRIVLGNGVDNSGAVPGIFLDAQLATQAFVAWFTATEGTIYGRRLELLARDTRLDAGANREVYLEFCEKAFAAIGSMSAFDEGIISPVRECGIPDIRSVAVNADTMDVPSVYGSDAIANTHFPTNDYIYWKESYPGAEKKAALLYVDNDTTQRQTRLMRGAAEKVGYVWVVDSAIGLAETNYSTYVIELKDKEVEFLQFQGDAPQAVRLAKAMRQQGYWPQVYALQQNLYKPALIQQGGVDIEGAEISVGSVLNERIDAHPELQTYRQWLKQVDPQAEPTGQGAYSWGAGLLFVELAKQIGPELTREKLLQALSEVEGFTGNGLFPPQDVGQKFPSNCHIIVRVEGGAFVPIDPPSGVGFECRGKAEPGA